MTNILVFFLLHGNVYSGHCKDAAGKEVRCTKVEDKETKSSLFVMSMFHRTSITKNPQQEKLLRRLTRNKNVDGAKSALRFPEEGGPWLFPDPGGGRKCRN